MCVAYTRPQNPYDKNRQEGALARRIHNRAVDNTAKPASNDANETQATQNQHIRALVRAQAPNNLIRRHNRFVDNFSVDPTFTTIKPRNSSKRAAAVKIAADSHAITTSTLAGRSTGRQPPRWKLPAEPPANTKTHESSSCRPT